MSDKYISVDEYLMGRATLDTLTDEIVGNINTLIPAINELLEQFGEKCDLSSGIRLVADQIRIYKEINEKRKAQKLPEIPVPMGSAHLKGGAIDLHDKDRKLTQFCMDNLPLLKKLGLYMENPANTPTWVHLQIIPTHSRVFNPY